jgi:hypothetical protein
MILYEVTVLLASDVSIKDSKPSDPHDTPTLKQCVTHNFHFCHIFCPQTTRFAQLKAYFPSALLTCELGGSAGNGTCACC